MKVRNGFSLSELVLAVGLLAMVILALAMLGISTIRSSEKAARFSQASQVGSSLITRILYDVECDQPPGTRDAFWDHVGPAPWQAVTPVTVGGVEYEYEVFAETVLETSGVASGTVAGEPGNRVKKVDLVMTWMDSRSTGGFRRGYGRLELQLSRLVNERGP